MPTYSNIFIISGPSGAGEDSVIDGLEKVLPIERIITTTTRDMRQGESQGSPYYFMHKEAFEKGIRNNEFIEYARQYNDNLYGVSKQELDRVTQSNKIGIWKIEYKGVQTVKKLFPEIKSILIDIESLEILESRIRKRDGEHCSEAYIQERMEYTKEWLKHKDIYDYSVVNETGKLDQTIEKVAKIIQKNTNIS